MSNLGVINWIVLLVYFVAMMMQLGTQVGKSNSNTESYFLGSRKIPWWAVRTFGMATQCSAVSVYRYAWDGVYKRSAETDIYFPVPAGNGNPDDNICTIFL